MHSLSNSIGPGFWGSVTIFRASCTPNPILILIIKAPVLYFHGSDLGQSDKPMPSRHVICIVIELKRGVKAYCRQAFTPKSQSPGTADFEGHACLCKFCLEVEVDECAW